MGKKSPYKVEAVTLCGTPYTVGKGKTSQEAVKIAELHRHVTGRRATIFFNGKRQAY